MTAPKPDETDLTVERVDEIEKPALVCGCQKCIDIRRLATIARRAIERAGAPCNCAPPDAGGGGRSCGRGCHIREHAGLEKLLGPRKTETLLPDVALGQDVAFIATMINSLTAERDTAIRERDEFKASEKELSDAYLTLRYLLRPWGSLKTAHGGANRFKVTSNALELLLAYLTDALEKASAAERALAEKSAEVERLKAECRHADNCGCDHAD